MAQRSIFDIIGPVMIGPSSSHTAGAVKLGRIARYLAGEEVRRVTFHLHGSFAQTYRGHGTDRALLAGILGMSPDDKRLCHSRTEAHQQGMQVAFVEEDLGPVHPNSVRITMETVTGAICEMAGSSLGGGRVLIWEVDGAPAEFHGDRSALVVYHRDCPGVVSQILSFLSMENVNVATMKLSREIKGADQSLIIETDQAIPSVAIHSIRDLPDVITVKLITLEE